MASKASKVRALQRARKLRTIIDRTTVSEQLYALGVLMTLWAYVQLPVSEKYHQTTLIVASLIMVGGLVVEGLSLVVKLWENKYSKVLVSLVIAIGSTFTIALSATIVSGLVGTDPSKLPYTTAIVSFLLVPFIAWSVLSTLSITAMVLYGALIPFGWMYRQLISCAFIRYSFRLKRKSRKERYFWIMVIVRIVAIGLLLGVLQFSGLFHAKYFEFVTAKASQFIYNFELYSKTHCTKLAPEERVGYIHEKLILVGEPTSQGYSFTTRTCTATK